MSTELYDEIINLPFIASEKKYVEILTQVEESEVIPLEKKSYLKNLDGTKEKWCLAYRKEENILGIQTTSRMESLHAMMKSILTSRCSLTELLIRLLDFAFAKSLQESESKTTNEVMNLLSKNLILSRVKEICSDYIYQKCVMNFVQASNFKVQKKKKGYEVVSMDSNSQRKINVKTFNSKLECECWYYKQWEIPCSHIFSVVNTSPETLMDFLNFKERWKKEMVYEFDDKDLIEFLKSQLHEENKDAQTNDEKESGLDSSIVIDEENKEENFEDNSEVEENSFEDQSLLDKFSLDQPNLHTDNEEDTSTDENIHEIRNIQKQSSTFNLKQINF